MNALTWLSLGLSAVVSRLEPKEAAAILTQAMSKTTESYALFYLAVLSRVATHLRPKEAAEVAATLTQAMSKTTDPDALPSLAKVLSALASRLAPTGGR